MMFGMKISESKKIENSIVKIWALMKHILCGAENSYEKILNIYVLKYA